MSQGDVGSGTPVALRFRVGVMKFPDGWNVIVDKGNGVEVYEPTYATEAEAQAIADKLSTNVRRRWDEAGLQYERR